MMNNKSTGSATTQELPQGDNAAVAGGAAGGGAGGGGGGGGGGGVQSPHAAPPEHQTSTSRNQVIKSGPLFISSKGIGWTSWKKRWFILTSTSLVFFRSDPSNASQKGNEMNLTLGGIDLNNSASVEVKVDKKLLTVFFPDGPDGRAFTLKAETLEDLQEWKTALENAVAQAPTATHAVGQNGILKTDQADLSNGLTDQQKDRAPIKSMVIGRPILLALEDIDGSPSFLEKALKFIEDHGVRVEGILRQAADVELVHRRINEYEQGKTDFSPDEDAHIIADCIKYILRELPSSPVPASCCKALLEAYRTGSNTRINTMRTAILETFPEPNRRLLQRILVMMQQIASHKAENLMSVSAVAACMSPLLLRPLLAGDCELENTHMDVAGDSSFQLLQAAAAANHAQAIVIILLEEYHHIFGEGSMSPELFSNSEESGSGSEEGSDEDDMYEDDDDDEYDDDDDEEYEEDDDEGGSSDHEADTDDDDDDDGYEHSGSDKFSGHGDSDKESEKYSSVSSSPERDNKKVAKKRSPTALVHTPSSQRESIKDQSVKQKETLCVPEAHISTKARDGNNPAKTRSANPPSRPTPAAPDSPLIRSPRWERSSARKNLSMDSIDFSLDDEDEIERLEAVKSELENRIPEEGSGISKQESSLERRKKALFERRIALEKDVARLRVELQKERDAKAGSVLPASDEKTKAEMEDMALQEEHYDNLKQRLDDITAEIHLRPEQIATHVRMNKDGAIKDMSHHIERSSKGEGQRKNHVDGGDHESEQSSKKNHNQSNEAAKSGNSKFGWLQNSPNFLDIPALKHTTSKKANKGEGGNPAFALSKLTNRLNFLKERRNQIASELQNIDKSRGSSGQGIQSLGRSKAQSPDGNFSTGADNEEGNAAKSSHLKSDGQTYHSVSSSGGGGGGVTSGDDNNKKGENNNRKGDNHDATRKGAATSKSDPRTSQDVDRGHKSGNHRTSTGADGEDRNRKGDNNNRKVDNRDGK